MNVLAHLNPDYTPTRVNCIAGEIGLNVICRRPDGYYSDIVVKTTNPIVATECPICDREMIAHNTGFMCSNEHVRVVMTTLATTLQHFSPEPKATKTEVVAKPKKKSFFSRLFSRKRKTVEPKSQKVDMADVKRQVADALEDLL